MKYFITGGCGFLGSNLAAEVLKRGEELFILDNLSRIGSNDNLLWLNTLGKFKFFHSDIRSYNDVEYALKEAKPDFVFHLAGQVAMTTSLINPRLDFETNVLGGHNLLENVRKICPEVVLTYSSTNKVYGDLEYLDLIEGSKRYLINGYENGLDERIKLEFQSPYGCSKGAIDQYMLDYNRMFNIRTIVFRHSSIFGGRQYPNFDQGWIGWFISQAKKQQKSKSADEFTVSGNGKQVRDILFASDIVNCYFKAISMARITAGQAYNIGGGMENSMSILELFDFLEKLLDVKLRYECIEWRQSDQKYFVSNFDKALNDFQWMPKISKNEGLLEMLNWVDKT
jgi:CDP-paratose 2-epimerase